MNNVRCTTEGEKSNKCYVRNQTILFVHLSGTAQEYLFHSYKSPAFEIRLGSWQILRLLPRHMYVFLVFVLAKKIPRQLNS